MFHGFLTKYTWLSAQSSNEIWVITARQQQHNQADNIFTKFIHVLSANIIMIELIDIMNYYKYKITQIRYNGTSRVYADFLSLTAINIHVQENYFWIGQEQNLIKIGYRERIFL